MNTPIRIALVCLACALSATVFAQPTVAQTTAAQVAPAPARSTGMGMQDMQDMPGMAQPQPAPSSKQKPIASDANPPMPTMLDHPAHAAPAMPGMDRMSMSPPTAHAGMDHDDHAMHDMRMQGGAAPDHARSADYSDGLVYGDMPGMDMLDAKPLGMLQFDQLEAFHSRAGNGQHWEMQGWYGTDANKLWVRSEGEREGGKLGDGDIEALWNHAVAPFWDTQLGVRHDLGPGPARNWAAFGVQGLAPYWFELSTTAYAGPNGRTAARLRVDYELLFTQRLILQPELEVNAYGKADPQRRLGSGVSDASFGLRLRYEFSRQFAPYVGVTWTQRYGGTAAFARAANQPAFDRQWVAGVRFWF